MKENQLTEGNIYKVMLYFAIPFLIANILQSLYGAVDLFVIGRYCGAQSVAAVSTGTQVTQIVTSLMTGLTLGSTILIGDYMGRKDYQEVKAIIGTAFIAFAVFAVFLTIVMIGFEAPLLRLLQTPAESFELTMQYVRICLLGNIFVCGYNAVSAILRGYGDSKNPMIFVGIACAINIVLDFVFVKYFVLGVAGTALATIISQGMSMAIAIVHLKRQNFIFDFKLSSFQLRGNIVKKLLKIGVPISFQELMIRISFLYLMAVMNHCGVYAAAVVGISSKYDVFAMLAGTSMANALAAITAQNIGAGKEERARKSLWMGMSAALCIAGVFLVWAQVYPEGMIRLFTKDANVIQAGIPFFRSCSFDYVLVTIVFCLNGYLNGCQKTMWTMLSSSFGALVLRIPLVYLFAKAFTDNLGMLGKIAPTVSGIMAAYTLIYVIRTAKKQKKQLAENR